jgi:hypothetical protein
VLYAVAAGKLEVVKFLFDAVKISNPRLSLVLFGQESSRDRCFGLLLALHQNY